MVKVDFGTIFRTRGRLAYDSSAYPKTLTMISTLSALAFVGSASAVVALKIFLQRQERRKNPSHYDLEGKNWGCLDSSQSLTKEEVLELRNKRCSKSVSLSYANSGPLMIVKVSSRDAICYEQPYGLRRRCLATA
jgi:hypothetical protein